MPAKTCANHEKEAASASCHQCQKPLCKQCVMVTPAGTFCSSSCSMLHREMKGMGDRKKKGSGMGAKLVLTILCVVIVGAAAAHFLAPGTQWDVIGKFMKKGE